MPLSGIFTNYFNTTVQLQRRDNIRDAVGDFNSKWNSYLNSVQASIQSVGVNELTVLSQGKEYNATHRAYLPSITIPDPVNGDRLIDNADSSIYSIIGVELFQSAQDGYAGLDSFYTGLTAYWPFNLNLNDLSGNGFHLISTGTTEVKVGNKGVLIFNNVNQIAERNNADLNNLLTDECSITTWVQVNNNLQPSAIGLYGYGLDLTHIDGEGIGMVGNSGAFFGVPNSHLIYLLLPDVPLADLSQIILIDLGKVENGDWHFVRITRKSGGIKAYVDEIPKTTFIQGSTSDSYTFFDASRVTLASFGNFTLFPFFTVPFDGALGEFRVYKRVITKAEGKALYNNTNPLATQSLDGHHYRLLLEKVKDTKS